jgi:glycosyltransferase involved in cell wall biosynthesis
LDGDARIELSGPVEDAIRELASAKVVVVPLLSGSGTRFKIIEAWAAGRAVVSTSMGAEGLPVKQDENLLLADNPATFADAVTSLLTSAECRQRLGAAGRLLYESEYTWESAWKKLDL